MYIDVSDTETGVGMKKGDLPSQNAIKEVAVQSMGNKRSTNKDGSRVSGTEEQKKENRREGKSAVEGGDIEMHGLWPKPLL